MKRTRAERIYARHIAPYHNCDVVSVEIYRPVSAAEGTIEGYIGSYVWETANRIPVNPLGENENGENEYENDSVSWSHIRILNGADEIVRAIADGTPLYLMPRLLSYGDYDNSSDIERSNYRVFMAEYGGESFDCPYAGSKEGTATYPGVHSVHGHYGSTGVLIALETWLRYSDMRELIGGLDDYPCIDDEDTSRVAMALADEAWESWACDDFTRELEERFNILEWEDYNKFDFRLFFENCRESANEYWEVESGGNSHVDIGRIVDAIESLDWTPPESYSRDMPLCLGDFVKSVELEETE
jgi:hypothetical protein